VSEKSGWKQWKDHLTSSDRSTHSRQSSGQKQAASKSDGLRRCRTCKGTGIKNNKPCPACKNVGGIDLKNV
jgi:hypothetical protein